MRFIILRLRRLLLVMFLVSLLTFVLVNWLPGDVAYQKAGMEASKELVQSIRQELGLDQPVLLRFVKWLGAFVTGDWGRSFLTGEDVREAILSRFPVSFELMILAQLIALGLALPLGIISATRAGGLADRAIAVFAFFSLSIPSFMGAILLITFFSLLLGLLPATDYQPLSAGLWANLRSFILPALSIALVEWTVLMRVLRAEMIGVLQEVYILVARAKGLPRWRIIFFHALRPSLFTMITILGLQVGGLLGGSLIVESIFALPGVGRLLIQAIYSRDFMIIQGVVTFIALVYVLVNFLVDMLYAVLDPRIRMEADHG